MPTKFKCSFDGIRRLHSYQNDERVCVCVLCAHEKADTFEKIMICDDNNIASLTCRYKLNISQCDIYFRLIVVCNSIRYEWIFLLSFFAVCTTKLVQDTGKLWKWVVFLSKFLRLLLRHPPIKMMNVLKWVYVFLQTVCDIAMETAATQQANQRNEME